MGELIAGIFAILVGIGIIVVGVAGIQASIEKITTTTIVQRKSDGLMTFNNFEGQTRVFTYDEFIKLIGVEKKL